MDRADAGGIIAAIFEALEPIEQPLRDIRLVPTIPTIPHMLACNSFDRQKPSGLCLSRAIGGWHVAHIKSGRKRGVAVDCRVQAGGGDHAKRRRPSRFLLTTIAAIRTRGAAAHARSRSRRPRARTRSGSSASATTRKLKLLLLTGGPGLSHAYLEVMDSYLPAQGVEYYHYDQLETGESDRPNDPDLWTLPATSTRSTRSARRSAATRATSACSATAGAACWRWNMRSPTRTR